MTNVLIVEDDPLARKLFENFIGGSENYRVEGSIDNADMAFLYCSMGKIGLVLLDIRTSMRSNGLDAAERIKERYPEIKVIIITSMPEYSYIERAREIGVDSFWYKDVIRESFMELIDRTMQGERIFPDSTPELRIGLAGSRDFSGDELEVLRELITGDDDEVIAGRLGKRPEEVSALVDSLMNKTGITHRTELAVRARDTGLVIRDS